MLRTVFFIGMLGIAQPLFANIYHLKLLSDTTPDLSSIEAFGYDIGHNWEQNNDKAIVLGYWLGQLTKYGSPLYFSRQWDDPIAFLNNNSYGMCSDMTLLLNAMGEGAYGFKGRHHELNRLDHPLSHTVPEIEYDNALHFMDPSYGLAYCHYDNGVIASMKDAALNPYLTQHNLPSALTRDSDGEGPIKAWMSYGRKDRTSEKLHHGEYTPSQTWIEKKTEGYYGVHTFDISLREDEYYTRYWGHLDGLEGFNPHDFFWPHYNFKSRNDFSWHENAAGEHRSNGIWVYEPNLNNPRGYDEAKQVQAMDAHIHPTHVGAEGRIGFSVDAANFITGVVLDAEVRRRHGEDHLLIEASSSGGNQWFTIWEDDEVGEHISIHKNISDMIRGTLRTQDLRQVTDYRVRIRLRAALDTDDVALNHLKLSTVTLLNKNALPKLKLGRNEITIEKSTNTPYQTCRFNPVLAKLNHGENGTITWHDQEVWQLYAQDYHNVTAVKNRTNLYTGLWKTSSRLGWVTYQMDASKPIKRARVGGSFIVRENSRDQFEIKYRIFNGAWGAWQSVAHYDWQTRNNSDARENQTHLASWEIAEENVSKIEFRIEMQGYPHIEALHMEIDHETHQSLEKPLDITYAWSEYHEDDQGDLPLNADAGISRTYKERVSSLPHTFVINTGGDIQPRMDWVSMNVEGSEDPHNTAPLGYSDGVDCGNDDAIPMVTYDMGEIISIGENITASATPRLGNLAQLLDGRITSSEDNQHSNHEEIVAFDRGIGQVEFVIDLGSRQPIGGVRVDAYLEDPFNSSFPESVWVEARLDGHYQLVGQDHYGSAKYAHNLWSAAWSIPEHAYSRSRGRFPNYGSYSNYIFIPFDHPVKSRYIKVRVQEQRLRGEDQGFALSEIHLYDHLVAHPWSPKLAHAGRGGVLIPPQEQNQTIEIEAEQGAVEAPLNLHDDDAAFGSQYITSNQHYQGQVTYTFDVPADGVYKIWARYIAPDGGKNSFFVTLDDTTEKIWDLTPLSTQWRWGEITGRGEGVLRYNLEAGEHHLLIRTRERLSALDKLIITSDDALVPVDKPTPTNPPLVYEDAEDGNIQGWSIFSNSSGEASIHNVYDNNAASRVISLEGVGRGDGYMLGRRRGEGAWQDTLHTKIAWRMCYTESFTIYIALETRKGRRYLTYSNRDDDRGLRGSYIGIGLGHERMNGVWQQIERNLEADLHRYEADNEIVSVNAFMVRGSGRIDDIQLDN